MGDGDLSRHLRELARRDADAAVRAEALRAAARLGRLDEALAAWAGARPPPGQAPIEADVVETLVELGHGWGDPRLIGEALAKPGVTRWAQAPRGATRLAVHHDLSWSRQDPTTGALHPLALPEGMPWSTGRSSDDVGIDAFMIAPGEDRALLAVTFIESPMLDADEFAGFVVVDLANRTVLDAHPPDEDFLLHAASPDLRGCVMGLYHQVRLRRVGSAEELPLPFPGRFLDAWPGPGPGEVSVWWRPAEGEGRLDRLDVGSGEALGPGFDVGHDRVAVVPSPATDSWVLWSCAPSDGVAGGKTRLRWVDAHSGAVLRELRARVPADPPTAMDASGKLAGFPGELRRVSGFRVVGRFPSRGPGVPGGPVAVPQGPTLQEVDPYDGRLLRGPEASRTRLWDVAVQAGPGAPWLLAHGGAPGELRARALEGNGRSAFLVGSGPLALDRDQVVVAPVSRRGTGWRADLFDPRTGRRRPVRWRGRGGRTCGTGDVNPAGLVAMATSYAELAVGRPEDPVPRWVVPRHERRHSPVLRWVGDRLLAYFAHPSLQGEVVWLAGDDGRELVSHPLGEVGFQTRRLQAAPGNAFLLLHAGPVWVVPSDGEAPWRIPVEEVSAACPLDADRVLVVDPAGTRRVLALDGEEGPTWEGPDEVRAVAALPGGTHIAVVRGAWIGFEEIGAGGGGRRGG